MKAKTAKRSAPAKRRTAKKPEGPRMVTFMPTRNLPLTINGQTIEVQAGVEATIPANYKAQYDNAS